MAKPTSTSTPKSSSISLLPEDMISGGLPDDFDGRADKLRFVPFNYGGHRENWTLAVRVDITPDEDSGLEPFSQYYSAGDLTKLVPTNDGETPAGGTIDDYIQLAQGRGDIPEDEIEQYEGIEALPIGKQTGLANNSNLAHFITTAIEAGFPHDRMTKAISCFEGVYAHWNRLEQKSRKGLQDSAGAGQGERKGDGRLLLITEVKSVPKAGAASSSKKSTPSSSTTKRPAKLATDELKEEEDISTSSNSSSDTNDFDAELSATIVELLSENDGSLTRGKLIPLVMKKFTGSQKAIAMKTAGDVDFLSGSEMWSYDEESKTLTLAE